ncbi:protein kinase [Candidatus Uabimicrobium sp. HlEnr_7]|uniref:protein kinase domain-containing protein n=1 Tax=Candidatus Uabimicrobium helgolandensis TaxID=3095367 RepID=UPI0035561639
MNYSLQEYLFHLLKTNNINATRIEFIWNQKPPGREEKENIKWFINNCLCDSQIDQDAFNLVVQKFNQRLLSLEASKKTLVKKQTTANISTKQFGKYKIIKELGSGNMGRVLLVEDPDRKAQLALKTMLAGGQADQQQESRFLAETSAMQKLKHPNIIQIYDVGKHNNINFFTMEYLKGLDLEMFLTNRKISSRRAVQIFIKIAEAIQHAHKKNILHRDIKPSNVLMRNEKDPVVTDFGLARFTREESRITQTGALIGTPAYMAPEQAHGKTKQIDERTDIYALGITLYKILTQQVPFSAPTPLATLHKIVNAQPTPARKINPLIPQDLENIVMKAIAKKKEERFSSVGEMIEDLQRFLDGVSTKTVQPSPSLKNIKFWTHKHKLRTILIILLTISTSINLYTFLKNSTLAEENILKQHIKIISPNILKTQSSDALPSFKKQITIKINLPLGITEIHANSKKITWDQTQTNFETNVKLKYGRNIIEIIFLHSSGRYYKLNRSLYRAKAEDSSFFLDNISRLSKAKKVPILPLKLLWKFPVKNARIIFSPLVLGKQIFFGDLNGFFYCINDEGNLLWKFESSAPIYGYGSIFNGIVYFGNDKGDMYGLDIFEGKKLFHYNVKQSQRFSPLIAKNTIYINTEKENLYAVNLKTSQKEWHFKGKKGEELYCSPSMYKNIIIITEYEKKVYALNKKNGKIAWQYDRDSKSYSSAIVIKDKVYISCHNIFYALNAQNGHKIWSTKLQGKIYSTGIFYKGMIFVVTKTGLLHAINLEKEKVEWVKETMPSFLTKDNSVWSCPSMAGDDLFINSIEAFYSINVKTNKINTHKKRKPITGYYNYSSPIIYKKRVYIGSTDGFLRAYGQRD